MRKAKSGNSGGEPAPRRGGRSCPGQPGRNRHAMYAGRRPTTATKNVVLDDAVGNSRQGGGGGQDRPVDKRKKVWARFPSHIGGVRGLGLARRYPSGPFRLA